MKAFKVFFKILGLFTFSLMLIFAVSCNEVIGESDNGNSNGNEQTADKPSKPDTTDDVVTPDYPDNTNDVITPDYPDNTNDVVTPDYPDNTNDVVNPDYSDNTDDTTNDRV